MLANALHSLSPTPAAPKPTSKPMFFNEAAFSITRAVGAPSRHGKVSAKRYSAGEILSEAARLPGHCAHVDTPSMPNTLFGCDVHQLLSWWRLELEPAARAMTTPSVYGPRRQRSDTPTLLVAVASYPAPADDNDANYRAWRAAVVAWAREHYGAGLRAVVEHTDEPYGHIHIIVARGGHSVKPLMAGHGAALLAQASGASKAEQSQAYKQGCVALQDEFWQAVGRSCNLARKSPSPRPRRSRAAHMMAKTKELLALEAELEGRQATMAAKVKLLAEQASDLDAREAKHRHDSQVLAGIQTQTLALVSALTAQQRQDVALKAQQRPG